MRAITAQRERGCRHGLDGTQPIALDARNLDQPANRITGHPEMMLKRDLGRILDLPVAPAERRAEPRSRHRSR